MKERRRSSIKRPREKRDRFGVRNAASHGAGRNVAVADRARSADLCSKRARVQRTKTVVAPPMGGHECFRFRHQNHERRLVHPTSFALKCDWSRCRSRGATTPQVSRCDDAKSWVTHVIRPAFEDATARVYRMSLSDTQRGRSVRRLRRGGAAARLICRRPHASGRPPGPTIGQPRRR